MMPKTSLRWFTLSMKLPVGAAELDTAPKLDAGCGGLLAVGWPAVGQLLAWW